MASIFSRSNNRAFVKQLQEQAKKVKKAEPTIKKGGSLITKIQNIEKLVQERLGHYAKELELIQTPQRLHEYIDECINNGIIAIDTETTGLDPITDKIVGACIYTYGQKAAYIPINHISYITNIRLQEQLSEQQVAEEFQRLVDNNTKIIMFNAKFDIRVIRHQFGVYMIPAWCGFIAGKCLKNNEEESNLKYLWKKYCSQNKEEAHFTFDKMFEGLRFDLVPINTAYLYAAHDAKMTLDLYDYQKPLLTEDDPKCIQNGFQKLAKLYREIELPIIPIVADIEDQGVCIDTEYAQQLSIKYNEKLKKAEDAFHKELEKYQDQITSYVNTHPNTKLENPINIGSPTQLAELFYDILQVPAVSRKSPRGTGEEILEKMGHPLGKLILDYRGIAKLLNTYIDKLPATLNKKTHKIHCSFNSYGTDTGRFSCICKGSQICCPGGNKNIEDVQTGDYVYSYSQCGELQLNKVKKSWYTGKRKCIKLYWKSKYNTDYRGILICTPEHCIKTKNGWIQAKDLSVKDSIYFVNRYPSKDGYMVLQACYGQGAHREHKWIQQNYFNNYDIHKIIHHKDCNRLNNDPSNLQIVTAKEHINIHRQMKNGYCNAYDFTKEQLIKMCEQVNWDIRKIKHDYDSLKTWLKKYKINYIKEYTDSYNIRPSIMRSSGKFFKYKSLPMNRENLKYALELAQYNVKEAASYFGQNSYKFVNKCNQYQLLENHNVYKIEYLEGYYDVYDLEIENAHCFIANELCVHNSSNPNLQNIPSHNTDIRPMFVASKYVDVESKDNILQFLIQDEVQTLQGWKNVEDLQNGDIIMCDDGNYTVKNIEIQEKQVNVTI